MTRVGRARVLRPLADPRWGHAPPGTLLQLPAAEIEALRLNGLVEPIPTASGRRPLPTSIASGRSSRLPSGGNTSTGTLRRR